LTGSRKEIASVASHFFFQLICRPQLAVEAAVSVLMAPKTCLLCFVNIETENPMHLHSDTIGIRCRGVGSGNWRA